jgi:hypothetical protein
MYEKITFDEFKKALYIVNEYRVQISKMEETIIESYELLKKLGYNDDSNFFRFANVTQDMEVLNTGCSARLINFLKRNEDNIGMKLTDTTKISELSKISVKKFSRSRDIGRVTLSELKELCLSSGVTLQP